MAENWFLLADPDWRGAGQPSVEQVVGVWSADGGELGPLRVNPKAACDPVDVVLRLALAGRADGEQVQVVLRDVAFEVAMNGDGRPLVTPAPDGVLCVVAVTSAAHRRRVSSPAWRRVDLHGLVSMLADGVDVLFNPGGTASVRFLGSFVRSTVLLGDEEARAAVERMVGAGVVRVERGVGV
ncbi:type VII secretion system-associated protein [Actinokineospora bangkokensis]|uniref:SseB protein N-terminal domain-containing protein n=1 Tax=Actinokineospora bangkokensis TaxID=1193682 RepID=A0A1Q9LJW8_9PSEU|nr:type VII secretion system-associated protein [Actinokineospora bangkokensis]OLR92310.1 hypothetical protein BJP25_22925 [Actinokineospora bangkokensis]